jgi:hypothetical protein
VVVIGTGSSGNIVIIMYLTNKDVYLFDLIMVNFCKRTNWDVFFIGRQYGNPKYLNNTYAFNNYK